MTTSRTHAIEFLIPATPEDFEEEAYLEANPDVASAVEAGLLASGKEHFEGIGHTESRRLAFGRHVMEAKSAKVRRIAEAGLLASDRQLAMHESGALDDLPAAVAAAAGIVDTTAVSSNDYDVRVQEIIDHRPEAWILDAGAGLRRTYYLNVVNYEVVAYPTTDVLGIVERMPFRDDAFDVVLSNAVLEHVRDPFEAAREMIRVLKPGGTLYCAVPFLQPYHGYPHHYFNMTEQGLRSLFDDRLEVLEHGVPHYFHPAWTVAWMLNAWSAGLTEPVREEFMKMTVAELASFSHDQMSRPFVVGLDERKQFELASGTFLIARKPTGASRVGNERQSGGR
jgi:hypothetical protein